MRPHSDPQPRCQLKTATAIADPVLVRLTTGQGVLVLLAGDVTYEKAGVMRLHQVRWARNRAVRELFSINRPPAAGVQGELHVRQMGNHWVGTLTHQAIFRAPATRRGLALTNLSRERYLTLCAAAPSRLLTAGKQIAPCRAPAAKALFHRAKAAFKRVATNALLAKTA